MKQKTVCFLKHLQQNGINSATHSTECVSDLQSSLVESFWNSAMNFLLEGFRRHILVHLGWIIFLLVLTTILLASKSFGTNSEVKDVINTALALSSVFLASFAIVQSFFSSGSLDNLVSNLKSQVDGLRQPAAEIKEAADQLTTHASRIEYGQSDLKHRIDSLSATFSGQKTLIESPTGSFGPHNLKYTTGGMSAALLMCKLSLDYKKVIKIDKSSDNQYLVGYRQAVVSLLDAMCFIDVVESDDETMITRMSSEKWIAEALSFMDEDKNKKRKEDIEKIFLPESRIDAE